MATNRVSPSASLRTARSVSDLQVSLGFGFSLQQTFSNSTTCPRPLPLNTEIAVRNFRHQPAKFRESRRLATTSPRKRPDFLPSRLFQAGAALALMGGEYHVFRAALFSIVLTLAVGQNAGLLCKVWCHDATSAGCPHQDSDDVPKRERRRQLPKRRPRGGRVCSRGRATHRCCSGRAERRRGSSVPIGPFAY